VVVSLTLIWMALAIGLGDQHVAAAGTQGSA